MKKICILLSIILCVVSLSSCSNTRNVENVEIVSIESEFFSKDEINSAIDVVKEQLMTSEFDDCNVTKIGYVGDGRVESSYPKGVPEEPMMIITCEFRVKLFADNGFNALSKYPFGTYCFYLELNDDNKWEIINYGMG